MIIIINGYFQEQTPRLPGSGGFSSSSIVATPSFPLVGRHWINDDNWYATIFPENIIALHVKK